MRDALAAHDDLHTADGAHAHARGAVVSGHTARHGRRYDIYAPAAGGVQGLQALSPRHWPPLGAFIKLPALRVVHDLFWGNVSCWHQDPQNVLTAVPLGKQLFDKLEQTLQRVTSYRPNLLSDGDSALCERKPFCFRP
jgi:hypothetical protein